MVSAKFEGLLFSHLGSRPTPRIVAMLTGMLTCVHAILKNYNYNLSYCLPFL